jgi:insulysin
MLYFKQSRHLYLTLLVCIIGLISFSVSAATDVQITKSPYDKREYKGLYLDNGLKVLLVSDPQAEKAAAALNVEVGSFNDPVDREGIAHFLEHMLFLGTKKYPITTEYDTYIASNGGTNNAWTGGRNTQYIFNIIPSKLEGALDRFAQFFIEPLFNVELVDRERNAVNSEYKLSLQKDGWRINAVKSLSANPAHPIVQFHVGDLVTLGDADKARAVRDDLLQFYSDYYSADRMTLAVVAPQSIQQLESWVTEYFSAIPKRTTVKPNEIDTLAFTKAETAKQIAIQTLGDYQEISLDFPIPSQQKNYDKHSLEYILYLLQQSGPKSLYQLLKKKNWITSISASSDDITYAQDLVSISFSLTNSGQEHVSEIIGYTFAYLKFIQQMGPQQNIFDDLRFAGDRDFTYADKTDPMSYVAELPMQMQRYPLEQVLTAKGFTKTTVFDANDISSLLNYFNPDNMRLIVANKAIEGDKIEQHYNVSYKIQDFPAAQKDQWLKAANDDLFAAPGSNPFMPKDFSPRPKLDNVTLDTVPMQVLKQPGLELWHKQDQSFNLPRQNLLFLLAAPDMQSTPKRSLILKFAEYAINDKLSELATQFDMAGLNLSVSGGNQGFTISISMFSDQQQAVLQATLGYLQDYKMDPAMFIVYKEDIKRNLINFKQNHPFTQASTILVSMIMQPAWLPADLLAEIDAVSMTEVEQYMQQYLQQIQVRSLMHGNITKPDAEQLATSVAQQLQVDTKREKNIVLPKLMLLPNGAKYHYDFDPEHNDAAMVSYYQAPKSDDRTIALNSLLVEIIDVPLYAQLRTKEQLGYVVGLRPYRVAEQTGIMFIIESPTKTPNFLNNRLYAFSKQFRKVLAKMPADEFSNYKHALQANLLEKPNSLAEETGRYWSVIVDGTYRFNLYKDLAGQLEQLSLAEVSEYFNVAWLNPKVRRNVTVSTKAANEKFQGGKLIESIADFKAKAKFISVN